MEKFKFNIGDTVLYKGRESLKMRVAVVTEVRDDLYTYTVKLRNPGKANQGWYVQRSYFENNAVKINNTELAELLYE
jgi:hypothetical protein